MYLFFTSSQCDFPLGEKIEAFHIAPLATITDAAPLQGTPKKTRLYNSEVNQVRPLDSISLIICTCSSFNAREIIVF